MSETKTITVLVREVWIVYYEVEATDIQDARNKIDEKIRNGTAEPRDSVAEQESTLSPDTWTFEIEGKPVG